MKALRCSSNKVFLARRATKGKRGEREATLDIDPRRLLDVEVQQIDIVGVSAS